MYQNYLVCVLQRRVGEVLLRDWQNCFFTTCSLIIYKSAGLIFAFHSVENILALLLFLYFAIIFSIFKLDFVFAFIFCFKVNFCMLKIFFEVIFFLAIRLGKQISLPKCFTRFLPNFCWPSSNSENSQYLRPQTLLRNSKSLL